MASHRSNNGALSRSFKGDRNNGFGRRAYLSCLGLIFSFAFASFYVQYPGLLSDSGLEPVRRIFPHAQPVVHRFLARNEFEDVDSLCEILALVGVLLSCLIASGKVQHGLIFVVVTSMYNFLVSLGGTFYSFQWDILLIETGVLTSLCYAPWLHLHGGIASSDSAGAWVLRFLLFKLMFMSGVVKIQSNCPTWHQLTALEYHFATQCLPTALAWYAHQAHPLLLRMGVAATLLIEIALPLWLLLPDPLTRMRQWGAILQIFLQILILLTGNYNFFNLLTMALCIPCITRDNQYFSKDEQPAASVEGDEDTTAAEATAKCHSWSKSTSPFHDNDASSTAAAKQSGYWLSVGWKVLQAVASVAFVVWFCTSMFRVTHPSDDTHGAVGLELKWTKLECENFVNAVLPMVIPWTLLLVLALGLRPLVSKDTNSRHRHGRLRRFWRLFCVMVHTAVCAAVIGVASMPLLTLTPTLQSSRYLGAAVFAPLWKSVRPFHFVSGYGLFRRMTGVGEVSPRAFGVVEGSVRPKETWGWAGLPPSVVARPEVIVEVSFLEEGTDSSGNVSVTKEVWKELNFRWKPGNVTSFPRQVAPHQPRLDWQMWFAALGDVRNNPWLVNLMRKILQRCEPVMDLLGSSHGEDDANALLLWTDSSKPPPVIRQVRAGLWHYDFTRVNVTWNRGIPGAALLGEGPVDELAVNISWWQTIVQFATINAAWTRKHEREYLPPVSSDALSQFLTHHGFENRCIRTTARCDQWEATGKNAGLCLIAVRFRSMGVLLLPFYCMAVVCIFRLVPCILRRGNTSPFRVQSRKRMKNSKKFQ